MQYARKEDIPGYREEFAKAFRLQQSVRDLSFLEDHDVVLGRRVRLPNLIDIAALSLQGNSFVCGGQRRLIDAALAMWLLSPEWEMEKGSRLRRWRIRRRRDRYTKALVRQWGGTTVMLAMDDFFVRMFVDSERGASGSKPPLPRAAYPAYYGHFFMFHYKAPESWVLSCPIPRLLQYVHQMQRQLDPNYSHHQLTDQVNHKYLKKFNEMKAAEQ
jgi:hypothetical protein